MWPLLRINNLTSPVIVNPAFIPQSAFHGKAKVPHLPTNFPFYSPSFYLRLHITRCETAQVLFCFFLMQGLFFERFPLITVENLQEEGYKKPEVAQEAKILLIARNLILGSQKDLISFLLFSVLISNVFISCDFHIISNSIECYYLFLPRVTVESFAFVTWNIG